jgi:hypothetical protein
MHNRRITSADFPAVLALQEASLFTNLTEQQREEGFLSAAFTRDHFRQMADEVAVLVADDAGKVCAYLCAGSVSFHSQFPLLAAMITALDGVHFLGRPLASQRMFIYGPACVARSHRRRGVLRGLYDELLRLLAGEYEVGVGLVAKDNPRSLAAHTEGLGMGIAGDFAFAGMRYWIIAFPILSPQS